MVRAYENIYRLRVTEYEMAGLAGIMDEPDICSEGMYER